MAKHISPVLLEVVNKTVSACGVELYDIEFKGKVLQVFITGPDKITVDICAKVSQALSLELDMQNLIPARYFLEVSSPGLERKLRNADDFKASIGKTVAVKTRTGKYIGKTVSVNDLGITLLNITGSCAKPGSEQFIAFTDINSARITKSDRELFYESEKLHKH
jgi:ribosome maturation factor RimP